MHVIQKIFEFHDGLNLKKYHFGNFSERPSKTHHSIWKILFVLGVDEEKDWKAKSAYSFMLKCSKITVWILFKSIIQLQGENGIERLDVSIKEKDSDNTELLWSLNAIYSHEIWEEGRVHFKSKSTEKTYEYAVWIMKFFFYTISF